MIQPEKYEELKALGYTQEPHRIPMYKILYCVADFRSKEHLATASRIAEAINKYEQYVNILLSIYWEWGYVKKSPVKTPSNKRRTAGRSIWHWVLTKSGERKLQRLKEEFGEMRIVETQKKDPVSNTSEVSPKISQIPDNNSIVCIDTNKHFS